MSFSHDELIACIADLDKASAQISDTGSMGGDQFENCNALDRIQNCLTYIRDGAKQSPKIAYASAMRQSSNVSKYHRPLFNRAVGIYRAWLGA